MGVDTNEPARGYEIEFEFIHAGMRQDQRERQGFLGFALAANGLILGLLMRATPERTAKEAWYLVVLAAIVTLVAEQLTIRASQGVATAGSYIRKFIEPHFEGLNYQHRNRDFTMKGKVSSSRGFALAYLLVTVGFLAAWFVAPPPDKGGHTIAETTVIAALGLGSLGQVARLFWSSFHPWDEIDEAWQKVYDEERKQAARPAESDSGS